VNNSGQISPFGLVLLIACVVLLALMFWYLSLPPDCDPEFQVSIVGILEGFEQNSSKWNVQINNKSFIFDYWDKHYMLSFISKNVTITCCERQINSRSIYSLLSCYLTGED